MNIFHSIVFGAVEGITEFLPISSTAHLEIVQNIMRIPSTDFVKSFEIVIQLGAIFAVLALYIKKIFSSWQYFRSVAVAFIPTGIIGFVLYKIIKNIFLGNLPLAALMLILGGIFIIIFEKRQARRGKYLETGETRALTVREALAVGTAQALAVVPGVSRSAAVIIAGRSLGLPRATIVEFSFLLAIPTMLAASAYDLYKSGLAFSGADWKMLAVGFVFSFAVALASVGWLLRYIKKHSFSAFGWYRIALGVIVLLFFI